VGIDLGTAKIVAAIFQNGNVDIVTNYRGNRTTPAYVACKESEWMFGDTAKSKVVHNASSTVFDFKRFIGLHHKDPLLVEDMKRWPFSVDINKKNQISISIDHEGEVIPSKHILKLLLMYIRNISNNYLGTEIGTVVLTSQAYMDPSQKSSILSACRKTGLTVLEVIPDTTAAVLAYGFDKPKGGNQNVLVFDLGAGSLSVTVFTVEKSEPTPIASTGDSHLGGNDFDTKLVDHCCRVFESKHHKSVINNTTSMQKLRIECEKAKITLSMLKEAVIEIDALFEGLDFYCKITRKEFDEMCKDLFLITLKEVKKAMHEAELETDMINEIIVVGGSSRIPRIQELLQDLFEGAALNRSLNPEEAVAYGAAVRAEQLSGRPVRLFSEWVRLPAGGPQPAGGLQPCWELPERRELVPRGYFAPADDGKPHKSKSKIKGFFNKM